MLGLFVCESRKWWALEVAEERLEKCVQGSGDKPIFACTTYAIRSEPGPPTPVFH